MQGTARIALLVGFVALVALATGVMTVLAGGRLVTGLSGAVGVLLPVVLIYIVLVREESDDPGTDETSHSQ
jgi:hypothetical protein